MAKESAGLLLYRKRHGKLEFLLVHPGGPFWKNKDSGAWTIPKGEVQQGENPLETAQREVQEELGYLPVGEFLPLQSIEQKGRKKVHAWAVQCNWDSATLQSNTFTLEWPPRSGKQQQFPEVDQAAYFELEAARIKINPAQIPFLEELMRKL